MSAEHPTRRRLGLAGTLGLAWLAATPASALDLRVAERDMGALGQETHIYMSGEIRAGDADRVAQRLGALRFGPGAVAHVVLDSPGGSLVDGMEIGRIVASLPTTVTTDVGASETRAADCASACVFIFMGGHYRSLREGSRLGVHQFYPTGDTGMTGAEGVAVGQVLSAEIVDYMTEMRVDPTFFNLMTRPMPEEILWVSAEDLDRYRVTTGPIRDQRMEYRNADGFFYLTLWQHGFYGENKLLLSCNDQGSLAFIAYLEPPDLRVVETQPHDLKVTLDGAVEAPAMWDLIGTDETWAVALFTLTPDQMTRLADAQSFGARMIPGSDPTLFFGFDYRIGEDGAQIRDMIDGCRRQQDYGFEPASDPDAILAPLTGTSSPQPPPPPDDRASRLSSTHHAGTSNP